MVACGPRGCAQVRAFTAGSCRVSSRLELPFSRVSAYSCWGAKAGFQYNGGTPFPPTSPPTEWFTPRSHLHQLWEHCIRPVMLKLTQGFITRSLVRINVRGLLPLLWVKQRSRRPSQPYATAHMVQWKHNGCFCEGALTLAQHFRERPTLMQSCLGSHCRSQL